MLPDQTPICRIITVNANIDLNEHSHSFASVKYFKRRKYVEEEILPSMRTIMPTALYNAVTPADFIINEDSATCIFENNKFKIGLDWNYNKLVSKYLISLFLTNYKLWIECCTLQQPLLILEDDLYIKSRTLANLSNDFVLFNASKYNRNPSVLYLQANCPWRKGYPVKTYPFSWKNYFLRRRFIKVPHTHRDMSGTVAILINPKAAKVCIDFAHEIGIHAIDQFYMHCMFRKLIFMYIQSDWENGFSLNLELQ
jgi:hypothetical protein